VSKSWNGGRDQLLDAIDLTLEEGTRVSLVGANGAGKTTLLRILAGLIFPDRGDIVLNGLTVASNRREYQRRMGFLPAGQTGLYARFSVRDHLDYWAHIAFVGRRERRDAVERTLRRFELAGMSTQRADRLSMGQRQRLRLAMAFLHEPSLVLLDEPGTSLDPEGLDVLREAVVSFVEGGGTAVWCAPDSNDVHLKVDAAFRLADGKLCGA
jgi:ABC-2 type transport system ATP-binding protein